MAGKIQQMIKDIIDNRAKGNHIIESATRIKLIFKGITPQYYDETSYDDPEILRKLENIASEMGVKLTVLK